MIKYLLIIGVFLSSISLAESGSFDDSYYHLVSKAQVYQYTNGYVDLEYTNHNFENKKTEVVPSLLYENTEHYTTSGRGYGATFIGSYKNFIWGGLHYEKNNFSKMYKNEDTSEQQEMNYDSSKISPFLTFKIANRICVSIGGIIVDRSIMVNTANFKGSALQYESGFLYFGNHWETGVNYISGTKVRSDNDPTTNDLDMEEAGEIMVYGRVKTNAAEYGVTYKTVQVEGADLSDIKDSKDYDLFTLNLKYKGFKVAYGKRSESYVNESDLTVGGFYPSTSSNMSATLTSLGYDGSIGLAKLGFDFENIIGSKNIIDSDINPATITEYRVNRTKLTFIIGYSF